MRKKTFDWIESIINPVARGPIHPITQREIPCFSGGGSNLYEPTVQKAQGWNLDPISGTSQGFHQINIILMQSKHGLW